MQSKTPRVRLGDILKQKCENERIEAEKSYKLLGVRLEGNGAFLREEKLGVEIAATHLKKVRSGDFIYSRLFAWRGAFGLIPAALDGAYVSNEFPLFIIDTNKIVPRYLELYFNQKRIWIEVEKYCMGTTKASRNRFKEIFFLNFDILLPSLKEQQRIVVALERLMMKIDEVRQRRIDTILMSEEFLLSSMNFTFNELFTKYEKREVKDFCKVVRGGSPRPAGSPLYYGGKIPFLKVGDLTKDNSKTVCTYSETLKESGLYKSRLVASNTLMLTNSGATLGVPKICTIQTCFNDGIQAFLDISDDIDKEYLYYFFFSKTKWFREWAARGQGQPNLNTQMVKEMIVPIPPIHEQRRIVAYLDRLQAKVDGAKGLQAETEREMVALVPAVLAKAFGGAI